MTYGIIQTRFWIFYYLTDMNLQIASSSLPFWSGYFRYRCIRLFICFQDLIDRINLYFWRTSFCGTWCLVASNIHCNKFFPTKLSNLHWKLRCVLAKGESIVERDLEVSNIIILILLKKESFCYIRAFFKRDEST